MLSCWAHISIFRTLSNMYDGDFLREIVVVNCFCKRPPSEMFDRVLSRPLGHTREYIDQVKFYFLV